MAKLWDDFKFGVGLGMGLIVAYGVLRLVVLVIELVLSGVGSRGGGVKVLP